MFGVVVCSFAVSTLLSLTHNHPNCFNFNNSKLLNNIHTFALLRYTIIVGLPGVFFFYEISPLHVEIVEGYRKGYIAFFTSVCAIVGGVVTTMGLLDQLLYSQAQRPGGQGLVL